MTRADMHAIADALLTVAIFWGLVAILLTAPVWGKWMDGEADAWEREVADRHLRAYEQIRSEQ